MLQNPHPLPTPPKTYNRETIVYLRRTLSILPISTIHRICSQVVPIYYSKSTGYFQTSYISRVWWSYFKISRVREGQSEFAKETLFKMLLFHISRKNTAAGQDNSVSPEWTLWYCKNTQNISTRRNTTVPSIPSKSTTALWQSAVLWWKYPVF